MSVGVVQVKATVYANWDGPPPTDDERDRIVGYVYYVAYQEGMTNEASPANDWREVSGDGYYAPQQLCVVTGANWGGKNPEVTEAHVRALDQNN